MRQLKDLVKDNKTVRFVFFRDGALHYETDDGFVFPVPVEDAGSATFHRSERAMMLMRYIRKHLATIEAARQDDSHDSREGGVP